MTNVLFAYMSSSDLAQMKIISQGIQEFGDFQVFSAAISNSSQTLSRGLPDEAPIHFRPDHIIEKKNQGRQNFKSRFSSILKLEPLKSARQIYGLIRNWQYWNKRKKSALHFIKKNKIDVIVTGNDTTPYYLPVLWAGHKNKCNIVLARTANIFYHDESEGYKNSFKHWMRARMPEMQIDKPRSLADYLFREIVVRFRPNHITDTIWGRLIPYDYSTLLSIEMNGICPEQIWNLGHSWTSSIIISGDDEAEALKKYRIADDKVKSIGCVAFQNMQALLSSRDNLKNEMAQKLEFDLKKPIVVVTVMAGWEHKTMSYEQQFNFFKYFFSMLAEFDVNILLSLHPLSREEDYADIAAEYNLKFLHKSLIESLVVADIFLGTDNSSVVRWAISTGIPTMNFQFNPDKISFQLHSEYPNLTDEGKFRKWFGDHVSRGPIETKELKHTNRRPMNLIADGKYFQHFANILETKND